MKFSAKTLNQIALKYSTPFYCYSEAEMMKIVSILKSELAEVNPLICFAAKANTNLGVLRCFKKWGLGLDIVSGGELFKGLKAGFNANKVVFSGIGKTNEEILSALKHGILAFHVESVPELNRILYIAKQHQLQAPISFRFNPNVNAKTHPYISTGLKQNKFGMDANEINLAISILKKQPSTLYKYEGLSIHIGSQITSLSVFDESFAKLKEMDCKIEDQHKLTSTHFDLGGGLGINYEENVQTFNQLKLYCKLVRKHFKNSDKKIILEPGRLLIAKAGILVSKIIDIKQRQNGKRFYIIDAGMNDLMRPSLYRVKHRIVATKSGSSSLVKGDVVGPICESSDVFAVNVSLPKNLKEGDLLCIMDSGAYGMSMASQYNSRPRLPEILISKKNRIKLVRRRETYEDLIYHE